MACCNRSTYALHMYAADACVELVSEYIRDYSHLWNRAVMPACLSALNRPDRFTIEGNSFLADSRGTFNKPGQRYDPSIEYLSLLQSKDGSGQTWSRAGLHGPFPLSFAVSMSNLVIVS